MIKTVGISKAQKAEILSEAQANDKAGPKGETGAHGLSAYEVWLTQGNVGTEAQYLASLKGAKGDPGAKGDKGVQGDMGNPGLSAYEVWLTRGNIGTEAQYIASLKGLPGTTGSQGNKGDKGDTGPAAVRYAKRLQTNAQGLVVVSFPAGLFASGVIPVLSAEVETPTAEASTYTYKCEIIGAPTNTAATIKVTRTALSIGLLGIVNITLASAAAANIWVDVLAFDPT